MQPICCKKVPLFIKPMTRYLSKKFYSKIYHIPFRYHSISCFAKLAFKPHTTLHLNVVLSPYFFEVLPGRSVFGTATGDEIQIYSIAAKKPHFEALYCLRHSFIFYSRVANQQSIFKGTVHKHKDFTFFLHLNVSSTFFYRLSLMSVETFNLFGWVFVVHSEVCHSFFVSTFRCRFRSLLNSAKVTELTEKDRLYSGDP